MKYKIVILTLCFITIGLICFSWRNRAQEIIVEPNVYQNLLAEYERVLEDTLYTEEAWSNNIYDHVKRYIGKT